MGRGHDGARGPKLLFPITVLPPLVRVCRGFRPHVVQVHESDGALVALVVRTLRGLLDPSPRIVALLQVSYLEEMRAVRALRCGGRVLGRPGPREWVFRWIKAPLQLTLGCLTAWLADTVLAPSRRTANELERDYRVSAVEVLPNATGGRQAGGEDAEELPPPGFLLFVGRLRIRKGVEILLSAVAQVRTRVAALRLVVAGDGEHRGRLEKAVTRLDLNDQVLFLGRCDPGRVRALMSRARALVVPSIYEGMPLVILEAMMCSLPVVASSVSGIPEVVADGQTGWLVPPEDVDSLASVLEDVYQDAREARRRGEAGQLWVRRAAAPAGVAERWLELVGGEVGGVSTPGREPS